MPLTFLPKCKLHFFDYPRWLTFLSEYYAHLNIKYNTFARNQFLFSQNPYNNPATYFVSTFINFITLVGGSIEHYYGFMNLFIIGLFIKNNTFENSLLCLKNAMFFVYISCKINETTKSQLIRDTGSYLLSIIGLLSFYKFKKINIKIFLTHDAFNLLYFIILVYIKTPTIRKSTYYTELDLFQKYHKNKYNQIIHLATTSYGVIGVIQILHKKLKISYINIWCFLFLYTRYFIPDGDVENITILLFSCCFLLLKKFPNRFNSPIKILFISIVLQEFSHFIFNEPTYMSSYVEKNIQYELLIKHIIWLLPFEIRTLLN